MKHFHANNTELLLLNALFRVTLYGNQIIKRQNLTTIHYSGIQYGLNK